MIAVEVRIGASWLGFIKRMRITGVGLLLSSGRRGEQVRDTALHNRHLRRGQLPFLHVHHHIGQRVDRDMPLSRAAAVPAFSGSVIQNRQLRGQEVVARCGWGVVGRLRLNVPGWDGRWVSRRLQHPVWQVWVWSAAETINTREQQIACFCVQLEVGSAAIRSTRRRQSSREGVKAGGGLLCDRAEALQADTSGQRVRRASRPQIPPPSVERGGHLGSLDRKVAVCGRVGALARVGQVVSRQQGE